MTLLLLAPILLGAAFGACCAVRPRAVIAVYRQLGLPTNLFGHEVPVWRIGGAVLLVWCAFIAALLLISIRTHGV